jgi:hypothetical protein
MLTFATRNPENAEYVYVTWKDGADFPKIDEPDAIISMAADGEELALIRSLFEALPDTKGEIVIWPQDMARFIYLNLRVYKRGK